MTNCLLPEFRSGRIDRKIFGPRAWRKDGATVRSYILLRCEAENGLKMFLNIHDIVFE